MTTSAGEDFGVALAQLIQLVFSLLFPFMVLTACAASAILTFVFHIPQFALWAFLAGAAWSYATTNLWAMLALIAFVVAAFPLAWVAFREHAARASGVIGGWVSVAVFGGGSIWLAFAWPFSGSGWQLIVFAFLLLGTCEVFSQAIIGSLKIAAISRPVPGREVVEAQKAHGDARLAGEAEALSLLNSKK